MTQIDLTKVGRLVKVTLSGSQEVKDSLVYRELGEIDINILNSPIIQLDIDKLGTFQIPIDQLTFESENIVLADLDDVLTFLYPEYGSSSSTLSNMEEITVTEDHDISMSVKKKLVSISILNNTNIDMNLLITAIEIEDINIELLGNSNTDTFINKTFWTASTVHVTGVTGSITLLIERA